MSAASTINHEGTDQPLPVEVRERPTAHTSIYKAGQLVYDGAAASDESAAAARAAASMEPGTSLNQMLAWGIANSSPEELERRANEAADALLHSCIGCPGPLCQEGTPPLRHVGSREGK